MTREELAERLQKYEWSDIEFKQARLGASQDAYKTVSAFANTAGGWLVFGVREVGGALDVVGVVEVDKVQNDFLSTLRSGKKLNRVITVAEEATEVDGKTLLVFHVPESPRRDKPIYLGGNIRESFIRRGAGDERCTMVEIERFVRDASDTKYDGELLDLDVERVFDPASLRWYRRVFEDRNPGKTQTLSDTEFLHEWGFVREQDGGRLAPTRAAVLVLGRPRYVRHVLARPVVDCQFIDFAFNAWSPDRRWRDRIVVEENLVQAWLTVSERYMRHAEHPFRVDATTLRRDDDPPDYISFRESAINLLLHQDYGDQGRKPSIRFFRDRTIFWNPGDAFATTDQLLEPSEKEVRNPNIVAAFRRLGLSEQAGTGIRTIFRNWQDLGHIPPVINNDRAEKAFEVRFLREALLSDEQRRFQTHLGLRLTEVEARIFAFACRERRVSLVDAKAVTGLMGQDAAPVLEALEVQGVLRRLQEGLYGLAEHIEGRGDLPSLGRPKSDRVGGSHGNLVTDQVDMSTAHVLHRPTDMSTEHRHEQANMSPSGTHSPGKGDQVAAKTADLDSDQVRDRHSDLVTDQVDMSTAHVPHGPSPTPTEHRGHVHPAKPLTELSATQRQVLAYCDVPRLLAEIMDKLAVANRGHFKKSHLDPLIHDGLITMTNPDKPRVPGQRYILTEAGLELRALHLQAEQEGKAHG